MADERRSLRRGRDQGSVSPLSKVSRVSQEPSMEERPAISGTVTTVPVTSVSSDSVPQSVVVPFWGGGCLSGFTEYFGLNSGYSSIRSE